MESKLDPEKNSQRLSLGIQMLILFHAILGLTAITQGFLVLSNDVWGYLFIIEGVFWLVTMPMLYLSTRLTLFAIIAFYSVTFIEKVFVRIAPYIFVLSPPALFNIPLEPLLIAIIWFKFIPQVKKEE